MYGETVEDDADYGQYGCETEMILHFGIDGCQLELELPCDEGIECHIAYQHERAEDDEPQLTHAETEEHDADDGQQDDDAHEDAERQRCHAERAECIVSLSGGIGEAVDRDVPAGLACPGLLAEGQPIAVALFQEAESGLGDGGIYHCRAVRMGRVPDKDP